MLLLINVSDMNKVSNVLSLSRYVFLPGGGSDILRTVASCPRAAGQEASVPALADRARGATGG